MSHGSNGAADEFNGDACSPDARRSAARSSSSRSDSSSSSFHDITFFTSSPDGKALVHIDAAPPEARRQSQVQGPDVVTGVKIDDDTAVTRLQAKQRGKLARRKTQERSCR